MSLNKFEKFYKKSIVFSNLFVHNLTSKAFFHAQNVHKTTVGAFPRLNWGNFHSPRHHLVEGLWGERVWEAGGKEKRAKNSVYVPGHHKPFIILSKRQQTSCCSLFRKADAS